VVSVVYRVLVNVFYKDEIFGMLGEEKCMKIVVTKPEEKRPFGSSRLTL
jgi:hypothetical protein